jgi:plasmid stabilization system protein ParE
MVRKVIWTNLALTDLRQTADYIARDSSAHALSFVRRAVGSAKLLASSAELGAVVAEWNDLSIREKLVGKHRLIYRVKNDAVYVIGFIHGARDLAALWKREDREG